MKENNYQWITRCIHCGYFRGGHPSKIPCPRCGKFPKVRTDEVWELLVGEIKEVYRGKWWNPFTWLNSEDILIIYEENNYANDDI